MKRTNKKQDKVPSVARKRSSASIQKSNKLESSKPGTGRRSLVSSKNIRDDKLNLGAAKNKTSLPKSLTKKYVKNSRSCKVTFRLPKEAAPNARMVTIVGDFNNWKITETKMTKLKSGDFKATVEMPCNREYSFRYLVDSDSWENDWFADKYIPNQFGGEDSVVIVD
jgi:1,4-alpha-glucan branching enzyme